MPDTRFGTRRDARGTVPAHDETQGFDDGSIARHARWGADGLGDLAPSCGHRPEPGHQVRSARQGFTPASSRASPCGSRRGRRPGATRAADGRTRRLRPGHPRARLGGQLLRRRRVLLRLELRSRRRRAADPGLPRRHQERARGLRRDRARPRPGLEPDLQRPAVRLGPAERCGRRGTVPGSGGSRHRRLPDQGPALEPRARLRARRRPPSRAAMPHRRSATRRSSTGTRRSRTCVPPPSRGSTRTIPATHEASSRACCSRRRRTTT